MAEGRGRRSTSSEPQHWGDCWRQQEHIRYHYKGTGSWTCPYAAYFTLQPPSLFLPPSHASSLQREDLQPTQTLSSRDYYTDLQRQAEERRQARRQQRETDKQMELEHTQKVAEAWGWGGRWTRGSRGEEDIFRREYCSELQKMMTERSEQKRRSREEDIAREKQVCCRLFVRRISQRYLHTTSVAIPITF